MPPATFVAFPLSLWSERARWALDHHEVAYVERGYTPLLGAPSLRWKMRRLRGGVSLPVLLDPTGAAWIQSLEIARYAESTGGGAPLFRRGNEEAIARWSARSDAAIRAARALTRDRLADDPEAQREALGRVVPRGLAGFLRPTASFALRRVQRRDRQRDHDAAPRARLRDVLVELRAALGGRRFLLGDALSYADIAMAAALLGVDPGEAASLRLGPATRRAATDLELAGEFTDLLGWRDQLYAEHRSARSGTPLLR